MPAAARSILLSRVKSDRTRGVALCGFFRYLRPILTIRGIFSYLPTPPLGQDMTQGQFLSGV